MTTGRRSGRDVKVDRLYISYDRMCRRRMAVGLKRRIRILEELEVLLQRLYGEMEYAGNDMIDILKILQVESIYFSELWQRIIERLERGDSVRLWEVWREETKRKTGLSPICFLGQEEQYILQEVGRALGQTDRKTQLHMLKLHEQRLHKVVNKIRSESQTQARVYRVVGVTAGCFLVILFV